MKQSISDKIKFYGIDDELVELVKSTKKKISSDLEKKYKWICRNLSTYGNCFVNQETLGKINLDDLKKLLHVETINIREGENIDAGVYYGVSGYILSI